jgi:hypothetical protein
MGRALAKPITTSACSKTIGLCPFEGRCVQAPFMGTSVGSDLGMIAKQDEQSDSFLAGASSLSVSMTNVRAAAGAWRATLVCPVMSRTTNGHVNERDLSMKYLTMAAVAAAVLAWSQLAYAQGWEHCATEGGFCRAPAGAVIHYGREGAFAHRRSPPGGLPCSNDVFGDPIRGVHKECFLSY